MEKNTLATFADVTKYSGFWSRFLATIIDSALFCLITFPILIGVYGWGYFDSEEWLLGSVDLIINWLLPVVATVMFWIRKQATPGKMVIKARVVDAETGNNLTVKQSVIRYLSYIISAVPLGLGFFWVAWDSKKQGWHDKRAGTVVIQPKNTGPEDVKFSSKSVA